MMNPMDSTEYSPLKPWHMRCSISGVDVGTAHIGKFSGEQIVIRCEIRHLCALLQGQFHRQQDKYGACQSVEPGFEPVIVLDFPHHRGGEQGQD